GCHSPTTDTSLHQSTGESFSWRCRHTSTACLRESLVCQWRVLCVSSQPETPFSSSTIYVIPGARGVLPWSPGARLPQDFLLSSVTHLRYTYTRAVLPIPPPSSARLMGLGRVSDDL